MHTGNTIAFIALQRLFPMNNKAVNGIITATQTPDAFFRCDPAYRIELVQSVMGNKELSRSDIKKIETCKEQLESAKATLEKLLEQGIQVVTCQDSAYPAIGGLDTDNIPPVLYVKSDTDAAALLNPTATVGIVGTRDPSSYGLECTRKIVRTLSAKDIVPTLVSGLAVGIDTAAQQQAVELGVPTIAVIPTGIDDIYPKKNASLAERIARAPMSGIVSDYPPQTAPTAFTMLRRCHLIGAMSDTLIVPETKRKGGAQVTARIAFDYGKEVYAVPGRVTDPRSQGCNDLIKEGVAEMLTGLSEI